MTIGGGGGWQRCTIYIYIYICSVRPPKSFSTMWLSNQWSSHELCFRAKVSKSPARCSPRVNQPIVLSRPVFSPGLVSSRGGSREGRAVDLSRKMGLGGHTAQDGQRLVEDPLAGRGDLRQRIVCFFWSIGGPGLFLVLERGSFQLVPRSFSLALSEPFFPSTSSIKERGALPHARCRPSQSGHLESPGAT